MLGDETQANESVYPEEMAHLTARAVKHDTKAFVALLDPLYMIWHFRLGI